jgi:hypothetical protein
MPLSDEAAEKGAPRKKIIENQISFGLETESKVGTDG